VDNKEDMLIGELLKRLERQRGLFRVRSAQGPLQYSG
jgi:hypothetical protein